MLCAILAAGASPSAWAQSFSNKGLVGVGRVDNAQRDSFKETFGSLSGLALDLRSWKRNASGTYSGTLFTQPDRGYVKSGVTTNYRPRRNKFALSFTPDTNGSSKQDQLSLSLSDTTLYTEADGTPLTGLDPLATSGAIRAGFAPKLPVAFNNRLSLDAEGLVLLPDGTFFVSDEYGPYLYRFGADGTLLGAVRPPDAVIPKRNGQDSFSSDSAASGQPAPSPSQPTTGRPNNKGLEGLTVSADGRTLYTLMQVATRQDGDAGNPGQNRFARLFAYDITSPAAATLTGEWVLPLPFYTDSNNVQQVAEQHECVVLNSHQFLVLAHDGNGRGSVITKSTYRAVLIFDTVGATDIHGTAYDSAASPLAQNGILANGITPATSTVLIDINDTNQLKKFSLNNNSNDDSNTLADAWESLALAPALDAAAPDDYFLLVGNDNNFSTSDGFQDGNSYNASPNIDTMVLIYRVTLPGTLTAPSIITQPANVTTPLGQPVSLSVTASGNPAPTFQWTKNGVNIANARSATLTIPSAQSSDAGIYAVLVSNANSSITSTNVQVTVTGGNAPVFTAQPASQTVAVGGTVVFSAAATNSPSYQWLRDGVAIAGATSQLLVLRNVTAADAASYSVLASSSSAIAFSVAGTLTVVNATPADAGRLINLSILTGLNANETLTMGTVLGGTGTSGNKALLARAAGPSLVQFPGVTGVLPDPMMTLVNISSSPNITVAANNDWGGAPTLSNAFAQVGAFAYAATNSKDAALLQSGATALAPGNYTVQVRDAGSGSGTTIAELYDATPTAAFTATTPRLINVSVLKTIGAGGSLTAGFFVGGATAKTVLIRAIGPGLAGVGVTSGAMPDPQLTLFSGQTVIATNNDWGGDPQLTTAGNRVGAFAIANGASKDAMLLVTLAAGSSYTAQVSPATGTAGGTAIVEVYEVP